MSNATPATVVDDLLQRYAYAIDDETSTLSELDFHRIIRECRAAVARARADQLGSLHGLMGSAYRRLKHFDTALAEYKKAAQLAPLVAMHCNNIGAVLFNMGRFDEAAAAYEDALRRPVKDPRFEFVLPLNLVNVYLNRGSVSEAVVSFRKAEKHADLAKTFDAYLLAQNAARLGYQDDAVEYLARYLSLVTGAPLDELPAIVFVRQHSDELLARLRRDPVPQLVEAVLAVGARFDAPSSNAPPLEFSGEEIEQFDAALATPPDPTDALRRLLNGTGR